MLDFITWNVDPILIHIGDGGVRWYGLLWAIGIYLAFLIQVKLYKNENCPKEWPDKLFMWLVIGLIIGARVGHCWFYEWHNVTLPEMAKYCEYMNISTDPVQIFGWTINYRNPYIEHPLRLLKIWEGGLSSHGGAIGLLTAAWLLNKKVFSKEPNPDKKTRLREVATDFNDIPGDTFIHFDPIVKEQILRQIDSEKFMSDSNQKKAYFTFRKDIGNKIPCLTEYLKAS